MARMSSFLTNSKRASTKKEMPKAVFRSFGIGSKVSQESRGTMQFEVELENGSSRVFELTLTDAEVRAIVKRSLRAVEQYPDLKE